MALIIQHYIDLTKVDKTRLVDGTKLQITSVVDDATKFGNNVGTYESMSKEEKDSGRKRNYVGNGRVVWTDGVVKLAEKDEAKAAPKKKEADLPF